METFLSFAFMLFGLGFFVFVIRLVQRDHREAWEQRMMEAREFGATVMKPPSKSKHLKE